MRENPGLVWGRRQLETYFAQGLLESRTTFHLAVRLSVRANQVLLVSGGAAEGTGLWRAALPAFVALDVAVWFLLRRSDRFGLAWRLTIDSLDVAFWALSPNPPSGHLGFGVLVLMPLAVEAGFRWGLLGMLVPLVSSGAIVAVRSIAARPLFIIDVGWTFVSVLMGMVLWTYCDRLHRQAVADHSRVVAAERRRAFLAGQNSVAMGASSVVDAIESLVPVLGRPPAGSAMERLVDGWKARLGASTAVDAEYLQTTLLGWERHHNHHPDLGSLVEVYVEEGDGTTLLTGSQTSSLWAVLDSLYLRGRVAVRVVSPAADRIPGSELELHVASDVLRVPADRRRLARVIDPGPSTYVFIALLCAVGQSPSFGSLPVPVVISQVVACLGTGWWSHRLLVTGRRGARFKVFAAAVVLGGALTIVTGTTSRQLLNPDGDPIYPLIGLMLAAMVAGFYASHLPRWAGVVALVAVAALIVFSPAPIAARSLAAGLLWNSMPYPLCRRVGRLVAGASDHHVEVTHDADRQAAQAAYIKGQESVVAMVRQARDDAFRQLAELAAALQPELSALASSRLEEVDQRLIAIGHAPA